MSVVFTPDPSGDAARLDALTGGWWILGGTLTFTGSYVAGGEPLALSKLTAGPGGRLRKIVTLGSVRGYLPEYIKSTSKLMLWVPNSTGPATAEHGAAAYDSDVTASPIDIVFLMKLG